MRTLRLYDSLSRSIRTLHPIDGERLRIYACGPTVYGPAHIGNLLTFTRTDLLYRTAIVAGLKPFYVRNITDVDDKTIARAQESGQPLRDFTSEWTARFLEDCQTLNLLPPDAEPRATDFVDEQVALVENLLKREIAYVGGDGSVYFRLSSYREYGKLSSFDPSELKTQETTSSGAANAADEYERDQVADFALWKARKDEDGENWWEGPADPATGQRLPGRPGWHLECSAMSRALLGDTFDLHAGGEDLAFPHHENEIAQSICAFHDGHLHDEEGHVHFARHWWHPRHLLVEGKKMSKSLGNFWMLADLLERGHEPAVIRWAFLQGYWRQQLNFTEASLRAAASGRQSFAQALGRIFGPRGDPADAYQPGGDVDFGPFREAWDALAEDLNTPATFGALFRAVKVLEKQKPEGEEREAAWKGLGAILFALGLSVTPLVEEAPPIAKVPEEIRTLAEARWEAKKARDFARADALRGELTAAGWEVLDSRDGYQLKPLRPGS